MKITDVTGHILLDPDYEADATSSAQDDFVVQVRTDEGVVGIGESDINAWIAHACLTAPGTHTMDMGLRSAVLGQDPLDPLSLWDKIYVQTAMPGRRGALIHALGAIDIALWDVCGKAAGVPTHHLLGKPRDDPAQPYASLLPHARDFDGLLEAFVAEASRAKELGFRAAKLELLIRGPYASTGIREPDRRMAEVIAAVRGAVGPDFTLMVDVGYAWESAAAARSVIETWTDYGIYFVETPLWVDDLSAYAELRATSPIRIAMGEWLSTRHEFAALIERGAVDIVQPDVGRVGGLTEARRVCALARDAGLSVVPHSWKTGITVAATAQLAAVTPEIPFFEVVPKELAHSALRRELTSGELSMHNGRAILPQAPGLGVEVDYTALERFEQFAAKLAPQG